MIPISFSKPLLKKLYQELQIAYQLNNINLYRTIQALIWYGEGKAATDIAKFLQVTSRTIYNWVSSFICQGFSWLDQKRYLGRGQKSKLTKAQRKELYEMRVSGPEANGFECGVWNTALIAELILLKFGVKYNPRYLSTLLKKWALATKKLDLYRIVVRRRNIKRLDMNGLKKLGLKF